MRLSSDILKNAMKRNIIKTGAHKIAAIILFTPLLEAI